MSNSYNKFCSNSFVMQGHVRHRRFSGKQHQFNYPHNMLYLDLDEADSLFSNSYLSRYIKSGAPTNDIKRLALYSFNEEAVFHCLQKTNYQQCANGQKPGLKQSIINLCLEHAQKSHGATPSIGKVCLLTTLGSFGFSFNPISVFFCFDDNGLLIYEVALVTNTPWGEQHYYVIDKTRQTKKYARLIKDFHVSPFMPLDQEYHWFSKFSDKKSIIHMQSFQDGVMVFDASLILNKKPLSPKLLDMNAFMNPLSGMNTIRKIYWQALKLYLKGNRFYSHPESTANSTY